MIKTRVLVTITGRKPVIYVEGVDAMGRGRQKAKQTKVARKLKYYSPETDYEALQRELQAERRRKGDFSEESDDTYYCEDDDSWRYGDVPPATD